MVDKMGDVGPFITDFSDLSNLRTLSEEVLAGQSAAE